jgi:zinc/manganese transport system substrate-binding protein
MIGDGIVALHGLKDVAAMMKADMIVQNDLDLEGGMQNSLAQAKNGGVSFFTAADHITVRKVGPGEELPPGDLDQALGAADPHLWMDPVDMKQVVEVLADQIKADLRCGYPQKLKITT